MGLLATSSMETLTGNDGNQSDSSCLCPVTISAVETAAMIASKTSASTPMPSAPSLGNFSTPQISGGPFKLPQTKQHATGRHLRSTVSQSLATQQIAAKTKSQQASNTNSVDDNKDKIVLRSGKWTAEEELYANILIELFEDGRVDEFEKIMENSGNDGDQKLRKFKINDGMTLRAYLSRKLFCSPMRISKKFAGRGIGKLVYTSQRHGRFQGVQQRFPFGPGQISNNQVFSLPFNIRLNRLKEAETNFLKIAFPEKMHKKSNDSSAFGVSPSVGNRSSPTGANGISSTKSKPEKVHIMPATAYTVNGVRQPDNGIDIRAYQSTWGGNKLIYHQHRAELPSTTIGKANPGPASQPARTSSHPPLAPFPNNSLQLHQQNHGTVCSSYRTTTVPSYEQTPPRASKINSSREFLTQKQPSPLMAAPQLLSPNSKKTQADDTIRKHWAVDNHHERNFDATSRLQQIEPERKRQRLKEQKPSQIQVLEEAYISSVSPEKIRGIESAEANNAMNGASAKVATNPNKEISSNVQSPTTRTKPSSTFDWTKPMIESPKVPNFLSGFDKVSKSNNPFDQQLIENSPAYHTSQSFDDFHRFLGKGLSPNIVPRSKLKFPNLETTTVGPAIPSMQSCSPGSASKLQRKPRKQNIVPAIIDNGEMISEALTPIRKNTRKEESLSEAYAEAVRSSESQQGMHPPKVQCKNIVDNSNPYSLLTANATMVQGQPLAFTAQEIREERPRLPNQTQQKLKRQNSLDFSIEGMAFEDFGTFSTYPDTTTTGIGELISDDSEGAQLEEYYCDTKRELKYNFKQP